MLEDYRPRFTFEITEEQKRKADLLLSTHGIRKALFSIILDDVLDLLEEYGGMAIGLILEKKIKPKEVLPSLNIKKENKNGA